MRRLTACAIISLLALTACGKSGDEPATADAPASAPPAAAPATYTPSPEKELSNLPADFAEMVDCAAVFAAMGAVDRTTQEQAPDNPWFQDFAEVNMAIQTKNGKPDAAIMTPVMFGRREYWTAQPAAATAKRAEACKGKHRAGAIVADQMGAK